MASSNPFRRKPSAASSSSTEDRYPALDLSNVEPSLHPPPPTTFGLSRSSSDDASLSSDVPEERQNSTTAKKKIVKKVRVLSPPPLSPDSPEFPFHSPTAGGEPWEANNYTELGHLDNHSFPAPLTADAPPVEAQRSGVPPNPFDKTLQDIESARKEEQLIEEQRDEGEALKAANSGKVGMDVDAFRRLLLTGDSGQSSPAPSGQRSVPPPVVAAAAAAAELHKDAEYGVKPVSHQGRSDGILPNPPAGQSKEKKVPPPPPPSSRHGRSLRLDAADNSRTNSPKPASPTDAPRRPSYSDRNQVDEAEATSQKKAVPAPPPPRGHARAESKITAPRDLTEQEFTAPHGPPSRTETLRHPPSAPAPPPPRRAHTAGPSKQQDSSASSPTAATFPVSSPTAAEPEPATSATTTDLREATQAQTASGGSKLPPAPPPARNTSVRRPPSIASIDSSSRRVSGESLHRPAALESSTSKYPGGQHKELPPPPPSRARGSFESQRSLERVPRTRGINDVIVDEDGETAEEQGKGMDILKDLSALQKEVDALRGKR